MFFKMLGLMSGTSRDGIDAALIETDGETLIRGGSTLHWPYSAQQRSLIGRFCGETLHGADGRGKLDAQIALDHARAVHLLIEKDGSRPEEIDAIGFHGHTLFHDPEGGVTVQAGNPQLLADETGIDVVFDFRQNDMAHGGEGAPLAPCFHHALFSEIQKPVVVLNIGGVANLTWLGPENRPESMIAFDTGPGNAIIDDWIASKQAGFFDEGGRLAAEGRINHAVLDVWAASDFFSSQANQRRSLDRDDFSTSPLAGLSLEDGAATATSLTAFAVKKSIEKLPFKPERVIVTGGGRHNDFLMRLLQKWIDIPFEKIEIYGHDGDMIEAQAFAYLVARFRRKLPISWPSTTGVAKPLAGGVLYRRTGEKK